MQALVEIAGLQYDVKASDVVKVPHLQGNVGDVLEFDKVLLGKNGDETVIGTPYITGKVTAQLIEHGRDKKVLVFKKKRRKGYQKLNGHRQQFSKIAITGVSIDGLGSEEFELKEIAVDTTTEDVVDTNDEKVIFDDTAIADQELDVEEQDTEVEKLDTASSDQELETEESDELEDTIEDEKLVFDDTADVENLSDDEEEKEKK
jgi:large subunit ribosomal protein L21